MDIVIRPATAGEIGALAEVERDGDRRYDGYDGVPAGFDDTAAPPVLAAAAAEGRLWVAVTGWGDGPAGGGDDGTIVGFALAEVIDGQGHLEQLSVRLGAQGRGVGGRLVDAVMAWAAGQAMAGVTLCTFSDVAWNRPWYENRGFAVLPEQRWSAGVRAAFVADAALGLDLARRLVMHRPVDRA